MCIDMAITKELKIQSIVILAENFNPSLFSRTWLSKHGFVDDNSILPNSIFTPPITNLFTDKFNLLVLPNQMQFIANSSDYSFGDDINQSLIPIIKRLGDGIPYKAVGVNYNWFIDDNSKGIEYTSRELFFNDSIKISKAFDQPNARFGSYMSMDFEGSRLKLDVKPVSAVDTKKGEAWESIQCTFNFHTDISEHDSEDVLSTISKWKIFREKSDQLIKLL